MRGLEEITRLNEHPHEARRDDALFARQSRDKVREAQRFHGERVEARQRQNAKPDPLDLDRSHRLATDRLLEIIILGSDYREPDVQDRILSALDAQPPFIRFWQKLNDRLAAAGKPEAGYGQAREAFNGGKTPLGALTYIGKAWDGIRAIPSTAIEHSGRMRPSYHGEYREVTGNGTVWHTAINDYDEPIAYMTPEAALHGAKCQKAAAIDKAFR